MKTNKLKLKIEADPTKFNEEIRKAKTTIINSINQSLNIPSFSSYTANTTKYWKQLQKEMNQMNYKDLKRDNTVYHCVFDGNANYLFRFIAGHKKQIINCDTGEIFGGSVALRGSSKNKYRLANLEEQCRFYNEFGYKDAKRRVWKVGDNDSRGNEIEEFVVSFDGETIFIKNRCIWRQTCWLDEYEGEFPVEKSLITVTQEPTDILRMAVETSLMSLDQCRESLNSAEPEKVHWLKRFIRRIV